MCARSRSRVLAGWRTRWPPSTKLPHTSTGGSDMDTFHGPLRPHPGNPRYFADATGRAVYLTGSHTWAVLQDMWLEDRPRREMDYPGFLDMLQENGHNFLRFWS